MTSWTVYRFTGPWADPASRATSVGATVEQAPTADDAIRSAQRRWGKGDPATHYRADRQGAS